MKFSYENQGVATFLVCNLENDEQVDRLGMGMLGNNQINGILPVAFLQVDDSSSLRVNVSSKVQLSNLLTGKVTRMKLANVLDGICEAYCGLEEYFLDTNQLLTDTKYVFCDVSTGKTFMIYLPVISEDKAEQKDFTQFVKNIVLGTQFAQESNMDYVPLLMNYLNSHETLDAKDFLDFVKKLQNLPENNAYERKSPEVPAQQNYYQGNRGLNENAAGMTNPNQRGQNIQSYSGNGNMYPNVNQGMSMNNAQGPVPGYQGGSMYAGQPQQGYQGGPMYAGQPQQGYQGGQMYTGQAQQRYAGGYSNVPQNGNYSAEGQQGAYKQQMSVSGSSDNGNKFTEEPKKEKKKKKRGLFGFGRKKDEDVEEEPNVSFNVPKTTVPVSSFGQYRPATGLNNSSNPQGQNPQGQQYRQGMQTAPYSGYNPYQQYSSNQNVRAAQNGNMGYMQQQQGLPGQNQSAPNSDIRQSNNNFAAIAAAAGGGTTVLNAGMVSEGTTLLSPDMLNPSHSLTATLRRERTGDVITINQSVFHIGKERSYVHYFIPDNTTISRSHADIISRDGKFYIVDTNSLNHTYLNGELLTSNTEYELRSGDDLKLSDEHFEFRIR